MRDMDNLIGNTVIYKLTAADAARVNARRTDAQTSGIAGTKSGAVVHVGNTAAEGDELPLIVTRDWGLTSGKRLVNGQVLLDGNDSLWACSVAYTGLTGDWEPGTWVYNSTS